MTSITFDTLAIAKRLESRGFERQQAEAIAEEVNHIYDNKVEGLATKEDIRELRSEIKEMITSSQLAILKWIIPLLCAQILAILGILLKFK